LIKLIQNHKYFDEIYTVAKLFFPDERVIKGLEICHEGYVIENVLDATFSKTIVYNNGTVLATYEMSIEVEAHPFLTLRRIIMLTVYHALQIAVGTDTPWGALTGIRPSKLVREWLDKGFSDEEIIKVLQNTFCCKEEKAKLALTIAYAEKRITQRIYSCYNVCKPIGIYISIPFCPTRCIYCSFNAEHKPAYVDIHKKYILALIDECIEKSKYAQEMGYVVNSIYIGGGTPTVLSLDLLKQTLETISMVFNKPMEYTVEAGRPDTITTEKLKLLKQYGVNRIAVNPQTLSNKTLALIGRKHTVDDFFNAFNMARDVGFDCINVDLIVGLPSETIDNISSSIENIIALSPENITIHTLAIKRASLLNEFLQKQKDSLPDAFTIESMLNIIANQLSCEYAPYYLYRQKNMIGLFENIGYSKPYKECLYNVGMMAETQTILGIGAGAVSKFVEGTKITREFNVKNAGIYIERRNTK